MAAQPNVRIMFHNSVGTDDYDPVFAERRRGLVRRRVIYPPSADDKGAIHATA